MRPDPKLGGKMEPIIEVISEGWRMDIHTEVNEDEGVDLQCVDGNVLPDHAEADFRAIDHGDGQSGQRGTISPR